MFKSFGYEYLGLAPRLFTLETHGKTLFSSDSDRQFRGYDH